MLTVALLAVLVAVQTLGVRQTAVVDARLPAVLIAAGLLWMRQSFLVVILAAAVVDPLVRLLDLAS